MPTLAELKAALSDPAYYRQVGGCLLDAYNRGAVGGLLGAPVDMANGVLNAGKMAAGYIGNQTGLLSGDQMPQPDMMPVGGSEWIGQKMQDAGMVSPNRNMPAEMLAGLAGIPLTAMAAAKAGPMVEKGIGQAMANAQMPSTLNLPQYSGQRGAIAYHGSPHKFDKFSLDKIGTGEGAQAYGHGLYLAENPETASMYRASVAPKQGPQFGLEDGNPVKGIATLIAAKGAKGEEMARKHYANYVPDVEAAIQQAKQAVNEGSNLYKTDIPDEAVSRFLDWDKPLSQQAPEVQPVLREMLKKAKKSFPGIDPNGDPIAGQVHHLYAQHRGGNITPVADELRQAGIPGIRYLDGGSRGVGAGTSNYVAFDPEMIRILERNGQPTGLLPWQPGEWRNK